MDRPALEAAAVRAHEAGESWSTFWAKHESDVRRCEPHDRRRWRALYLKLFALVTSGDLASQRAVSDPEPQLTRASEARLAIDKDGAIIDDRFGQPKEHPALSVERQSHLAYLRLVREMGLDIDLPE